MFTATTVLALDNKEASMRNEQLCWHCHSSGLPFKDQASGLLLGCRNYIGYNSASNKAPIWYPQGFLGVYHSKQGP